ncbi:hypothetical protein BY996DRAFT_6464845 [Phakopsora pachyrhizi]|nr:hypothetical protein BY996DRAFT_6464845 [Phakopsora pachyrhizi]
MSQSHKPNYSQVESMDWEPSQPTSVERFLSKSMSSLPTIPTFTHHWQLFNQGVTIVGAGGTNSPKSQTLARMGPSYSTSMSTFVATLRYQGMLIHPQGLLRIASTKLDGEVGH